MSISIIGKSIGVSATLLLNEKAAILRAKGEPIIHLGGGEPQSKTPIDAITSFTGLLNSGEIRYTPVDGTVEMKQSLIRYTEEYWRNEIQRLEGLLQASQEALSKNLEENEYKMILRIIII